MIEGKLCRAGSKIPMILFAGEDSFTGLAGKESDRFELHLVHSTSDALDELSRINSHPERDHAVVVIEAAAAQANLVSAWAKCLLPRAKLLVLYRRLTSKHAAPLHCEGLPCTSETIERLFATNAGAPSSASN